MGTHIYNMKRLYLILLLFVIFLQSCDLYKQDSYIEQYVMEAYLVGSQPLPTVFVHRTSPIESVYDRSQLGVENAIIMMREWDSDGNLKLNIAYNSTGSGSYEPLIGGITVKPGFRYTIEVTFRDSDQRLTAQTIVPGAFTIESINSRELQYQGSEQFILQLTRSFYPGRQSYYVFTNLTLDPDNAVMTPFYADASGDREDFYVVSSGIVNETSTGNNGNDLVELTFPWIGVAFYGPNQIRVSAIDDNLYDLIRSAGIQLGGSTQSPGEIENVISRVNGGLGIFGSYYQESIDVNILKR